MANPPPTAVVRELQEYTALFHARAYVKSQDYWAAINSLQKDVQTALGKARILNPVTRPAPVVRNEPISALTDPDLAKPSPEKDDKVGTAGPDAAFPAGAQGGIMRP